MAQDVFISYSSRDKIVADTIVAALETNLIRCWYAPRDINPGADWAEEITKAIQSSKIMLLIFSENSNHSQRVLDEINYAISTGLTIIPFRIENLEPRNAMMLHLSTRHWLDAYDPSWEEFIETLIKTIAANLEMAITDDEIKTPLKKRTGNKKSSALSRIAGIILGVVLLAAVGFGLFSWLKDPAEGQATPVTQATATLEPPQATPTPEETGPGLGSEENPIIFMYHPSSSGNFTEISTALKQIAADFREYSGGLELKPIPASDYASIVDALCQGEAHIGSLTTFAYLAASEKDCAESKLIWNAYENISYGGMIIVRSNSGISSLADLEGKTLCIPDYTSISGWVLPYLELRGSGIEPKSYFGEIRDLGNHLDVVTEVYNGQCDAGSAYYDARTAVDLDNANENLTIIAQTISFPNENLSFSSEMEPEFQQTVIDFFLTASDTPEQLDNLILYTGLSSEHIELIEINDFYYQQFREFFENSGENIEDYLGYP